MHKIRNVFVLGSLTLVAFIAIPSHSMAQMTMPVVTVYAPDAHATWSGDPGFFTFLRQGPTNYTLSVFYQIRGTATNGVDYAQIGNWVTIPAGIRTNVVMVSPINNGQTAPATVVLQLAPPPTMPPVNYMIGMPSNAVVYITETITNIPPFVQITMPPNGVTFPPGANIGICANAYDPDGYVATVEFFADSNSLGITTNNPISVGPRNPFCLLWSNVPPGLHVLTALATDNGGATNRSAPVTIAVAPPPTNYPPMVRIMSPPSGAVFPAPANIPIYADARDPDDAVVSVELFAGTNSLGLARPVCASVTPPMTNCPTNAWFLIWSNAPVGSYVLRALATDAVGLMGTSMPVRVSVVLPPPPPTNRPPVVSIVALDPIAIEGTNCYVWRGMTNTGPTWTNCGWAWFTNCGPKNATFAVRRAGDTNGDLTVSYSIGGTATNGVDYVPLPGTVTIAAGERRALITVVPIDDGPPDINSTVILRLLPPPTDSFPPPYFLGFPRAAGALILDGSGPRPGSTMLTDRSFHLNAPGPDGAWFQVEYSTDMLNWTTVCENQVINGSIDFVDPDAVTDQARFYRAVPLLGPSMMP